MTTRVFVDTLSLIIIWSVMCVATHECIQFYIVTGMDITCLYTSSWEFICEGGTHSVRPDIHVTSNVIITYHCSA